MSDSTDLRSFLASARASAASAGQGGRAAAAAAVLSIDELRSRRVITEEAVAPARFCREQLTGRLVELSGVGAVATLSAAIGLVIDAQVAGEPVAWIALPPATFYPPDLADSGVDLDALVVVRAPRRSRRRGPPSACCARARSGWWSSISAPTPRCRWRTRAGWCRWRSSTTPRWCA